MQNGQQFDAAMALAHLMAGFIRNEKLPNGGPQADALLDALRLDAQAAGLGLDAILELEEERLFETGFHLAWLLDKGTGEHVLPFGTTVTSDAPGSVRIAGRDLVIDAARPGLHALETTSPAAAGPNLDLLHRLILAKTRKLACRRVGLPKASHITDADSRHLLQFPPLAEAGGVTLQRWASGTGAARFSAAPRRIIEAFADSIFADMRALWTNRVAIGKRVEEVRQAALAGIAGVGDGARDLTVDRICIDMEHYREGDTDHSLYLEYAGCDEALRAGRILEYVAGWNKLDPSGLWSIPDTHEGRGTQLAELQVAGANGRIEAAAAAIAASAPEGQAAVLRRLGSELETQVAIETREAPIYAMLFWRDGVINAEISQANAFNLWSDRIEVHPGVRTGAGKADVVEGCNVRTFCTQPFDLDAGVTEASELSSGGVRLTFERTLRLVNVDTGAIWPEPWKAATAA